MATTSLERLIGAGELVVVDSSAVLAYLDGTEATSGLAAALFDRLVASGRNRAIVSTITVTEVLVRPYRSGSQSAVGIVETFLSTFPNLSVAAVTADVAREAARIRAMTALRAPDALILATAVVHAADVVVANDDRWRAAIDRSGLSLRLCHLGALATGGTGAAARGAEGPAASGAERPAATAGGRPAAPPSRAPRPRPPRARSTPRTARRRTE